MFRQPGIGIWELTTLGANGDRSSFRPRIKGTVWEHCMVGPSQPAWAKNDGTYFSSLTLGCDVPREPLENKENPGNTTSCKDALPG
jgi:hypothetical protein